MRHIIILLTFFITSLAFGQSRNLHIPTYDNGEYTYWYKYTIDLSGKIGIDIVQNTKNNWYFRLLTDCQVIDIWEDATKEIKGSLTSWTEEYVPSCEEPTYRSFCKTKSLNQATVLELAELIRKSNIQTVPDEMSIDDWEEGEDGITYFIETADANNYYLKTYWCPNDQGVLKEAMIVRGFVNQALLISRSKNVWNEFSNEIPFETYTEGNYIVSSILTKEESKKYKTERDNYRRTVLKSDKIIKQSKKNTLSYIQNPVLVSLRQDTLTVLIKKTLNFVDESFVIHEFNPMHKLESDSITELLHSSMAAYLVCEEDNEDAINRVFKALHKNSSSYYSDSSEERRMKLRRAACFASLALLSGSENGLTYLRYAKFALIEDVKNPDLDLLEEYYLDLLFLELLFKYKDGQSIKSDLSDLKIFLEDNNKKFSNAFFVKANLLIDEFNK